MNVYNIYIYIYMYNEIWVYTHALFAVFILTTIFVILICLYFFFFCGGGGGGVSDKCLGKTTPKPTQEPGAVGGRSARCLWPTHIPTIGVLGNLGLHTPLEHPSLRSPKP